VAIAKTLDILLRAPTGKLDADMRRAEARTRQFVATTKSILTGLVGGFAIAGLGSMIRTQLDRVFSSINQALTRIDERAKRAIRFQVDISTLRGLDLAAGLSGVSVERLDGALSALTRSLDAARSGSKEQARAFRDIGIEVETFAKLDVKNQLQAIAVGLNGVPDKARKAAIAMKLFGKSGLTLLPMLGEDASQIVNTMKEAERLGGAFKVEEARSVEAANDAFSTLLFTVQSLYERIAVEMSPALNALFVNLTEAIKPGTALNSLLQEFGTLLTGGVILLNEFVGFVRFLSEELGELGGRFLAAGVFGAAFLNVIGVVENFGLVIQNARDLQKGLNDDLNDFLGLQSSIAQPRKLNLGSATAGSQAALEQLFTVKGERQGFDRVVEAVEDVKDEIAQLRQGRGDNLFTLEVEEVTV
jgi:hypothetical protein